MGSSINDAEINEKEVGTDVQVTVLEDSNLGHVPTRPAGIKNIIKSLGSKEAWLGDYVSDLALVATFD